MTKYYEHYLNENFDKNLKNNEIRDLNTILKNNNTSWALMDYDNNLNFQKKWLSQIIRWGYTYYFIDVKDKFNVVYKWMIIIHNPKQLEMVTKEEVNNYKKIKIKNEEKNKIETYSATTHHFFMDLLTSYEMNKLQSHQIWIKYPRKKFVNNKNYDKFYFKMDDEYKIEFNDLMSKILNKDIYYNEIYQIRNNNKIFIK